MVRLGIVIPTLGRHTLYRTADSITPQLLEGDAIHLVCDGGEAWIRSSHVLMNSDGSFYPWMCSTKPELTECPGATQRNWAIDNICKTNVLQPTHLLFIGDDDVYLPGAIDTIRSYCNDYPGQCLMFKMYTYWHQLIWGKEELKEGNVSDQMFVAPYNPNMLGRYTNRYAGDFDFIRETVNNFGEQNLVWAPGVIVQCRPED